MRKITLLMTLCLAFSGAYAEVEGENVKPGTRLEQQNINLQTEEEEFLAKSEEENKEELVCKSTYFTSHNGAFQNPVLVSIMGDQVTLTDGSIWAVAPGDTYKTFNWLTSDLLIITPNQKVFSNYSFTITNQNTKVSIDVNMLLGPLYYGAYTYWIKAIDYINEKIYLNDGSIWSMSWFDTPIYNKWLPNDTVIIGVNDGSLSTFNPNILINVSTLTYARGKCIY